MLLITSMWSTSTPFLSIQCQDVTALKGGWMLGDTPLHLLELALFGFKEEVVFLEQLHNSPSDLLVVRATAERLSRDLAGDPKHIYKHKYDRKAHLAGDPKRKR